jgi:hypothetical protein
MPSFVEVRARTSRIVVAAAAALVLAIVGVMVARSNGASRTSTAGTPAAADRLYFANSNG